MNSHRQHHQRFLSLYQVIGFLGQGSYGKVMKVKCKQTDKILAAKIICLEGLSPNELHRTHEEQRIHSILRHQNIISVYCSFLEEDQLIIVMQYCEYGDLHYYVKKKAHEKGRFSQQLIINFLTQMLFGLQYLHQNKIVHRDLKPSNIFVDSQGIVKLADFGLSKTLGHTHSQSAGLQGLVGTPLYLAPQICANQSTSQKADIWATGCILYELCQLKPPFQAGNILALATMIATQDVPSIDAQYSDNLNALVRWMLDKSPANRPTADQILKLSFMNKRSAKSSPTKMASTSRQDVCHHPYEQDEMNREKNHEHLIYEHQVEIQEEDDNEYEQKLQQNLVRLLGSEQAFNQMYRQIKFIKQDYVIINNKDQPKIFDKLLQIYGQQYLDIAKGVAELIDLQKVMKK